MTMDTDRRGLMSGLAAQPAAGARPAAAGVGGPGRVAPLHQTVTPIIPGKLFRIGCVVPAQRLSWLPADLPGYEPLNAYALVDNGNCLFMEMGSPVMLPAIERAMELTKGRKTWLWFSRNEADCIGNMGYLLARAEKPTLLFGSIAGGIFEWINDPSVPIGEVRDFQGRSHAVSARNGTAQDIGSMHFEFMDAGSKQMYMTQWVYEATTGTMFTSDSFGFRHLAAANGPVVVDTAAGLPSLQAVTGETVERFNWMREANFAPVIARFEEIFRKHDVQVLAPVHGCVIKGRDAVKAHVALAIDALHAASKRPDTERLHYV